MCRYTILKIALLTSAVGLPLALSPANAQDYGPYGPPVYYGPPQEQLEVNAPRFREEHVPLNAPLEKVSLSAAVPYGDLDLRSREGARELRYRVRDAAWQVCSNLAEAYPVYRATGTSCFKTAYDDAMVRADEAISTTRIAYRQSY